jgi:RimJ/RimL family protein N-acetyltransferase
MQVPFDAELTDGVISLRPLTALDAAAHLAGEDDELVRWLNGGPGTPETVRSHIERAGVMWAAGGPTFAFGIRSTIDDVLNGTIEVQLAQPYATETQANLAFGLYPASRGAGRAPRAVLLAMRFLAERTSIDQALIRADPANRASSSVARRAGFQLIGRVAENSGELDWFAKDVR